MPSSGWRAGAEAGGVAAALDRIAHQELLRAVALLVIVVDDAVGGAEAIEAAGVAVDGHRGVEQLAHLAAALAVIGHVEEHVERVAGLHLLLEVDVVGMDAEQLEDGVGRNVLALGCVIEARIERGALLLLGAFGGEAALLVGDDEVAAVVAGDAGEMLVAGVHAHLDRLHLVGVARRGNEVEADLLARLQVLQRKDRSEATRRWPWPGRDLRRPWR